MITEEWKIIEEYPNYEISNLGRVRNTKTNRILSPSLNSDGYLIITLSKDGKHKTKTVHRLVAKAFIENTNPNILIEVDHIDRNRANCCVTNLQWISKKDNLLKKNYNDGKNKSIVYINNKIKRTLINLSIEEIDEKIYKIIEILNK